MSRAARHLFLSGYMGVGKTSVGGPLARALDRPLLDLDAEIVAAAGLSIPEIFATEGEAGFRRRERAALGRAIAAPPAVIALGGGAVIDPVNRARIRAAGFLVTLSASPELLRSRLTQAPGARPLAAGDPLARLSDRAEAYADCDLVVTTDGLDPAAIARQILAGWAA